MLLQRGVILSCLLASAVAFAPSMRAPRAVSCAWREGEGKGGRGTGWVGCCCGGLLLVPLLVEDEAWLACCVEGRKSRRAMRAGWLG